MGWNPKRIWSRVVLSLIFPTLVVAAEPETITVGDFGCGLVSEYDPSLIGNGCAQDLLNVDVDNTMLSKRRGSIKQNSSDACTFSGQARRFVHEFPDQNGNFWFISVTSNSLCSSSDGGVTNSIITSTYGITSLSKFRAVNAFGRTFLTDGTTNWLSWNGAALTQETDIPVSEGGAFWLERLWAWDGSVIYYSRFGDYTDWTNNGIADNDAGSENIRLNDGYDIQAVVQYRDSLVIFKDYSIDVLRSNDGLTFNRVPISDTVGTQHRDTVVVRDNDVIFLSDDNFYSFSYAPNGSQLTPISIPIMSTVTSLQQLNSFVRRQIITTKAGFDAGTSTEVSTGISSGDVVLSTWTDVVVSSTDFWMVGAATNSVFITDDGNLFLSTNNVNIDNNDFEDCTADEQTPPPNWSVFVDPDDGNNKAKCEASATAYDGSYVGQLAFGGGAVATTFNAKFIHGVTSTTLLDTGYEMVDLSSSWQDFDVNVDALIGRYVKIQFRAITTGGLNEANIYSDPFYCSGGTFTFRAKYNNPSSITEISLDGITNGKTTISSGTYNSGTFTTNLSSPSWFGFSTVSYANGNTITFTPRAASPAGGGWNNGDWGEYPNLLKLGNFSYIVAFELSTNSIALPVVSGLEFSARQTSGTHLSQALSIGTDITSWGPFLTNFSEDSSTIEFEFYTDTDTASGIDVDDSNTYTEKQTITKNAIPSISTAAVAYIGSTFTITLATKNPTLNDYGITWNEGISNFIASAIEYEGDYYCAVAITSTTGNDTILIYDTGGAWTKYGFPASYLTLYRQQPYFGSNLDGDIVRFQVDGRYRDYDDTAINAYWISKEFDMGRSLAKKRVKRYYVTAVREEGSDAILEYRKDRGTFTSKTLDLDEFSGFYRKSFSTSDTDFTKGIQHSFKISDNDIDQTFDILSVTIKAVIDEDP